MPAASAGQFVSVDVTALVRQWITNPATAFGVAVQPALSAPGTVVFLDSQETTSTAHLAQLDLTLADQGPRGDTGPAGPVNLRYVLSTSDLPGNNQGSRFAHCPAGTVVVSGGCGHRDFNTAAQDILVNFSGPNPANPRAQWRCMLDNTSSSARAVQAWAVCAAATTVSGP